MSDGNSAAVGRPSMFSKKIAATICARIASGESLRAICEDDGMPARSAVYAWLLEKPDFQDQYARARELQAETFVDEIVEIADDGRNDWMTKNDPDNPGYIQNGEAMRRSQLRIDARKWHASKLAAKKYGDKAALEVAGKDGGALVVEIVKFSDAANSPS